MIKPEEFQPMDFDPNDRPMISDGVLEFLWGMVFMGAIVALWWLL